MTVRVNQHELQFIPNGLILFEMCDTVEKKIFLIIKLYWAVCFLFSSAGDGWSFSRRRSKRKFCPLKQLSTRDGVVDDLSSCFAT